MAGDGHLALAAVRLADQEVLVAAEAERVAVVHPERLDGLELAPDVGLEADEDQPAVLAVVLAGAGRQQRAVGAAPADDAVAFDEPAAEEAGRVARVGPADVGPVRAAQAERVVRVAEVVDPRGVARDRRVRTIRHRQRRAVGPAADDLRGELLRPTWVR